jgi:capsular polysaccharide biosynthesis protein
MPAVNNLNQEMGEAQDEISFQDLFNIFWKKRVLVSVLTILGTVTGALFSVAVNATSIRVATIVEYQWNGIQLGRYPNGSRFEVSNAFSPAVYNLVIETLDVDLTANEVRNALTINPIIPDDILTQIQVAVEKGETFQYFPKTFHYTLNAAALSLSENQGKQFLDTLINTFTNDLYATYVNQVIIRNFALDNYEDYDFLDQVNLINNQMETMTNQLESLMTLDPRAATFRSNTLGLSLNDILAQLTLVKTLQIIPAETLVISNQLSRDLSLTVARLVYLNQLRGIDLAKEEQYLGDLNELAEAYAGSTTTIIIPGYEGEINTTSALETIYAEMMLTQRKIADLEQDIAYNETLITAFENAVVDPDMMDRVQLELNEVVTNLTAVINNTNIVLTQLNDVLNRDLTRVLANATREPTTSVILSASIGLIVGGMLSLIISFMQREKPSKPTKKKSA